MNSAAWGHAFLWYELCTGMFQKWDNRNEYAGILEPLSLKTLQPLDFLDPEPGIPTVNAYYMIVN